MKKGGRKDQKVVNIESGDASSIRETRERRGYERCDSGDGSDGSLMMKVKKGVGQLFIFQERTRRKGGRGKRDEQCKLEVREQHPGLLRAGQEREGRQEGKRWERAFLSLRKRGGSVWMVVVERGREGSNSF